MTLGFIVPRKKCRFLFLTLTITILVSTTFHAMSQDFLTPCKEGEVLIADTNDNQSIASCVSPYIAKKFSGLGWVIIDENETLESLKSTDQVVKAPNCRMERLFLHSNCFLAKLNDELVFVITDLAPGMTIAEKLVRAAIFELNYQSTGLEKNEDARYFYTSDPSKFYWTDGNIIIVAVKSGPIGGWKPHHLDSQ